MKHGDKWSAPELAVLRDTYTRGGVAASRQALPHRSEHAIAKKAYELQLKTSRPRWDPAFVARLRAAYAKGGLAEAHAQFPDRRRNALAKAASCLRISKKTPAKAPRKAVARAARIAAAPKPHAAAERPLPLSKRDPQIAERWARLRFA